MLQTLEMPADNFFQNKEIIYIVYPGGCAGDLVSLYVSIQKNAKYSFKKINELGRVEYIDSTNSIFKNIKLIDILKKNKFNYKKMITNANSLNNLFLENQNTIVINSHFVNDDDIEKFLIDFEYVNKKILRISTRNNKDDFIRRSMVKEKIDKKTKNKFLLEDYYLPVVERKVNHKDLLEIDFKDILIDTNKILDQINDFLGIGIELANRGIFDLWKSKQPESIKQIIKEIHGVEYGWQILGLPSLD